MNEIPTIPGDLLPPKQRRMGNAAEAAQAIEDEREAARRGVPVEQIQKERHAREAEESADDFNALLAAGDEELDYDADPFADTDVIKR